MSVTALGANSAVPALPDSMYIFGAASGALEVNPGDYVAWSGQNIHAVHDGVAWAKASGAGIAMDRSPIIDSFGRTGPNTALIIATRGVFRVSANFSGNPLKGVLAYPDMTGSAVNAASGQTGLGALWNTGTPIAVSGGTGAAPGFNVAQVINWYNSGPAGTGQMDIRLWDKNGDIY